MERVFLILVFILTLVFTVVCLYITIKEVQLTSPPPKAQDIDGVDPFPTNNQGEGLPNLPLDNPDNPQNTENNPNQPDPNKDKQTSKGQPPTKTNTPAKGGIPKNPRTHQEFQKIIDSPQRDAYLLRIIRNKWAYRILCMQKIAQLKLVHLEPELRSIYQDIQAKSPPGKTSYFQLRLLHTIWVLNKRVSEEERLKLEKARLIPASKG